MQFSNWGDGSNPHVIGGDRLEGLVIADLEADKLLEAALAQRADPRHGVYPLFATAPRLIADETTRIALDHVLDGYVEDAQTAHEAAEALWAGVGGYRDLPVETPDARILSYMALRNGQELCPICDWRSREVYRYPLLEAFGAGANGELLGLLANRGLLKRSALVERLRLCPSCHGAHVLFVDACPNCHALEIVPDESIHCFTCGHVASQRAFTLGGSLQCPNCRARLRHIGTEYDRPLEHFSCQRCAERFTEPEVIARCSICRYENRPDLLITREAGRYQITEYGRLSVFNHDLGTPIHRVERNGALNPTAFEHLLGWQSEIAAQHASCHFTLLLLQLDNLTELATRMTTGELSALLKGLADQLPSLTRPGDVCTRTREAEFWVLMPQAGGDETQLLIGKIQSLIESSETLNHAGLHFSAQTLESANTPIDETSGNALMRMLAERQEMRRYA